MSLDYINEAFKSLDLMNEEIFDVTVDGLKNLGDFIHNDEESDVVRIIDDEAETEDELQKAYVGKVIVDCTVCNAHIFRNREDLEIDAEGNVDVNKQCPYCGETDGFVIIGEISEFNTDNDSENTDGKTEDSIDSYSSEDNTEDSSEEDIIEESLVEKTKVYKPHTIRLLKLLDQDTDSTKDLDEAFNNVNIETEDSRLTMNSEPNGKVVVTTEPISNIETDAEMITPLSGTTQDEIIDASAEVETNSEEESIPTEDALIDNTEAEEAEFNIDELDEESFDDLGESYLKRVYENVDSFKTTKVSTTPTKLVVEGTINFKSGASKNTGFIFEAKDATKNGKVRFIGENAHLCRGKKAFTLSGAVTNNKLIAESFTYNYRAKDTDGKSTRVYGTVNHKR